MESNATDIDEIECIADTNVGNCYQCGKSSAGCLVAERADLLPNQLKRLVQLGRIDRALRSQAIWKCVSCRTVSLSNKRHRDFTSSYFTRYKNGRLIAFSSASMVFAI
jgi:heterodisulfide reductase subunit C